MSDNKPMFGITKETKASNNAPLNVAKQVTNNPLFPNGWEFPITSLVNIVANPTLEKKDGSTTSVLQFIFKDKDNRQLTHTEWELDTNDEKFSTKLEGLNVRIKHIYTAIFGDFPQQGIGSEATSFTEFFELVKKSFDSRVIGEGESAKKIYPTIPLFTKVTYYKKNLGFPLSPNFLEKVVDKQPCKLLTINLSYDTLEAPKGGASGIPGMSGTASPDLGDLPSFDGAYS